MKLEDQVTSLELSKKLKKLGVKQESLFYWTNCNIWNKYEEVELTYAKKWDELFLVYKTDLPNTEDFESEYSEMDEIEKEQYSAFTVAELGELLPYHYVNFGKLQGKQGYSCSISPSRNATPEEVVHEFGKTEADARAKMLIYLLENNLISHPKKEEVG